MRVDTPDPLGRVQTIQRPVYYISEVLHNAKTGYLEVHKMLYAILIFSRKLHHYFQAHKVSVVTSYLLRAVLHNPNATDNIAKWAAEQAEFDLDFISCHAVKSQVLADFIANWMPPPHFLGGLMTVRQGLGLWSSLGLTGLSSSMAPHVSRGAT
jgi:hypothetical protein